MQADHERDNEEYQLDSEYMRDWMRYIPFFLICIVIWVPIFFLWPPVMALMVFVVFLSLAILHTIHRRMLFMPAEILRASEEPVKFWTVIVALYVAAFAGPVLILYIIG
ncbi:MAG: hypothetical protein ACMUHB_01665 [Thermoplasmatota archaeon]